MFRERVFRSRWLAWSVVGAVSLMLFPCGAIAQAKSGAMMGFIYAEDMKSPVEGAVVKLRSVNDGKEVQSGPTDKNGMYALKGIAEGRYVIGVSSTAGDFNFDYQLQVKANETAKLALALKPGVQPPASADTQGGKKKKAFFWTPLGIAIIVGVSAVLVYGGFKLFGEEEEKSPSKN